MAHLRSPEADRDLDDIWLYIARQSGSVDTAERLIDLITDRFFLLSRHPYLGRARDQDLRPGLRSFPVGAYVIVYRIQEADVVILRVLHGSRNITELLR
jgi:toxin ParE1/3/4